MTPYRIFALEVQCGGLAAEVRLNGLPVFREPSGRPRFTAKKCNPWVVDGTNDLEVRAARLGAIGSYLKLALAVVDGVHEEVAPENVLVRYEWQPDEQPLEAPPLQQLLLLPVDVGPAHGRWAWQSAQPYVDADRGALEAAVADLHATLARRDREGTVSHLQVKTAEMARALDATPAELEADLREWLEELFRQDDWQLEPLDPSMLQLEPSAGGRLVLVTDARGRPPVHGRGHESEFEPTELTYSHLEGGWTLVR
jgi:hypothetical protein